MWRGWEELVVTMTRWVWWKRMGGGELRMGAEWWVGSWGGWRGPYRGLWLAGELRVGPAQWGSLSEVRWRWLWRCDWVGWEGTGCWVVTCRR